MADSPCWEVREHPDYVAAWQVILWFDPDGYVALDQVFFSEADANEAVNRLPFLLPSRMQ